MELQSKYSGDNVSTAHYLAELMCERKAKKERKILIERFWKDDYWKKFYVDQIRAAYSLLKLYSEQAILLGVQDKSINWCYSLRIKMLPSIIAECEKHLKQQAAITAEKKQLDAIPKEEIQKVTIVELPRKQVKKSDNIINKLKDL